MSWRLRLSFMICLMLLPASARAQGDMLHGVGPINSSMGGAGTALTEDPLGALTFNPALIAGAKGNQILFSTEFLNDSIQIQTTYGVSDGSGIGVETGDAHPTSHLSLIPAFGWMLRAPNMKLAIGFGVLGIAGFATDYPEDASSLLFAAPPAGFGRIYTNFRMTKIPFALAYAVTPKLSLGASFNVYYGQFAVNPLPYQVFDTTNDLNVNANRYYPGGGNLVGRFAVAGQFGFVYQATPALSVGGSVTTPQHFSAYEWNSTYANPGASNYGQARTVSFDLGGPMVVSFGTGVRGAKTDFALDGMYTQYSGVAGFGSPGGIVDGIVYPFGWRNIWTVKAGVRHQFEKVDLRLGYNYSETPIRSAVILTATGAPATFENHICAGFGYKMFPFLTAEASGYYAPRKHVTGPFPNLQGQVVGTIDESDALVSALIGLNFTF